jgi:hypothetical protein
MSPILLAVIPFGAMLVFALIVVVTIRAYAPAPRAISSAQGYQSAHKQQSTRSTKVPQQSNVEASLD